MRAKLLDEDPIVGELIRGLIRLGIVVAIPALTLYLVNLLD
ncbi:hypothetical protein LJR009_000100 [Bosea sp. LjRoot9]